MCNLALLDGDVLVCSPLARTIVRAVKSCLDCGIDIDLLLPMPGASHFYHHFIMDSTVRYCRKPSMTCNLQYVTLGASRERLDPARHELA